MLLLPLVTITCGSNKFKLEGSKLASLESAGTELTELAQIGLSLKSNGTGKALLKQYINDSGGSSAVTLLTNFGSGFIETAESVGEEITFTTLEGKMFVISPR